MRDSKKYPRVIASLTEKTVDYSLYNHIKPVGAIAKVDRWFV